MCELRQQAQLDPNLILLFGDSAEVCLVPTITRCWTRIGQQRVIPTPGVRNDKRWDWGAVNVVTGETVHLVHKQRNQMGIRRLLAAIARAYALGQYPQRRVVLFLDNDKAHKAKSVTRLLAKHDHQIQIEWLPTYSPELNPQEDIWQHLRRRVTHNYFFQHIDPLITAVNDFHDDLVCHPDQVLRLISKWSHLIST